MNLRAITMTVVFFGFIFSEGGRAASIMSSTPSGYQSQVVLAPIGYTWYVLEDVPLDESIQLNRTQGFTAVNELMSRMLWARARRELNRHIVSSPADKEARYLRAICSQQLFLAFPSSDFWRSADEDFRWIVSQDSTYRDVLYQYALLHRFNEQYPEAIHLAHEQVRIRPDLWHTHHGLHILYRAFINNTSGERAAGWLLQQPRTIATYYVAEIYRKSGKHDEAEAVLHGLLRRAQPSLEHRILHSLAKLYYDSDRFTEAEALIDQLIDQIEGPLASSAFFDEIKYIITEQELQTYRSLSESEQFRHFYHRFWLERNPLPSMPLNARRVAHYHRLSSAERRFAYAGLRPWHTNPDNLGEIVYPATYYLNEAFNDKGLVYIRFGEPDDRIRAAGANIDINELNESWRYHTPRGVKPLDFHFLLEGSGNNWRFTPIFWPGGFNVTGASRSRGSSITLSESIREIIDSRAEWGGIYAHFLSARGVADFQMLTNSHMGESKESVKIGLTTDKHSWAEEVLAFDVPFVIAAFRGSEGYTQIEFHYLIPSLRRSDHAYSSSDSATVEVGASFHNGLTLNSARHVQHLRLPTRSSATSPTISGFTFHLLPDTYQMSFHARPETGSYLAGYTFARTVPDFSMPVLLMSDILLAHDAELLVDEPSRRSDIRISVNPTGRFERHKNVLLCFEAYNLTFDDEGRTRYSLEYTLAGTRPRSAIDRLLRRTEPPVLSLKIEQEGLRTSAVEYPEIDVSSVPPGRYQLVVRISDLHAGASTENLVQIEITD